MPAFLAWLGVQGWCVWVKVTLFVLVVIVAVGVVTLMGGSQIFTWLWGVLR